MIGPASRRHFMRALQSAGRAEQNIRPGALVVDIQRDLAIAQVELVRGIAYAFLQDEVSLHQEEDRETVTNYITDVIKKFAQKEGK